VDSWFSGSSIGVGGRSAAATGAAGVAGRLAVNTAVGPDAGGSLFRIRDGIAAVAPGDVGDNAHAIALLDAFTATNTVPAGLGLAGDRDSTSMLADFTSLIATKTQSSETAQAMRAARFDSLSKAEAIAVGVDLDVELQDLTLIEKTYAANAQVMNVIDELFDLLLQRL
jgi:flagellar hook-associated protein 1 FlgK